ncbi:MAG: hypothetical protein COT17_07195 [Elusimicrobia bacterium CG08_land_8_20_14_0_20_51_18]|nr:MAG: hypothetical protein COT17_07195 [Elusimicrobia bacterium CG08_land_8_20_14_0_20_51_18]
MLIIAGISTPEKDFLKWRKRIAAAKLKNLKLVRHVKNLPGLLAKASVTVGTAGAAAYEILFFSGKAVFIPYGGSPGREHSDQLARARLMKDLLGSAVIRPGELTGARLAAAIEVKIKEKKKRTVKNGSFFNGLKKTVDCLRKFHNGGN